MAILRVLTRTAFDRQNAQGRSKIRRVAPVYDRRRFHVSKLRARPALLNVHRRRRRR